MKNSILCCLLSLLIASSCTKDNHLESSINPSLRKQPEVKGQTLQRAHSTTSAVYNGVTGDKVGQAKLVRNKNGITVNFSANDLTPGYAYTLWWVIWNKPENCTEPFACSDADFLIADAVEVEVLYAGGHVVGNSGLGNFSAHVKEGDDSESINELFELNGYGGLQDAQAAEIHAVLRNHGPVIPDQAAEQINSYLGGCVTDLGVFTEVPDEEGECADTHFAVFLAL